MADGKWKKIGVWLLSGLLALLYLMSGGTKLAGMPPHAENFARWGWPDWLPAVVGTLEIASAVALLVPRAAFFGACALIVIMLGATYTHLFRATGEGGMAGAAIVLLVLASLIAWARRPAPLRSDASVTSRTSTNERTG